MKLANLKPGDLLRLVNSTRVGSVLSESLLRRHRQSAGSRIGDGKTIDFFRYAAWLVEQRLANRETPIADVAPTSSRYDIKKERERARNAARSRMGRDVGELPAVADVERRAAAAASLQKFATTYFPDLFALPFGRDHLQAIAKIEAAVLRGALFAFAMPRGSGKTTLCEVAALWAVLFGHRKFVAFIGASRDAAIESLSTIKTQLDSNDLLLADFPEVCLPVRRLEGRAALCPGQLHNGKRTRSEWGRTHVVLPTIDGSIASGAILKCAGITGRVRGMKYQRADGSSARPDFVIVDDPQTQRSAKSKLQCDDRLATMNNDILMLAGPGVRIAGVCPCTVIRRGDMADRLLTRSENREWNGERWKMVYAFPERVELWDEYADVRLAGLENGDDGEAGNAFYSSHREEMDRGAVVAWDYHFDAGEVSAIQHAMNLRIRNLESFECECQNTPPDPSGAAADLPTSEMISAKTNGLERGLVPLAATTVTAFIDVQHTVLYWVAVAWWDGFGGAVLDYHTYPEQQRHYFNLRQATRRLPGASVEECVFNGLSALVPQLARQWAREGGGAGVPTSRILIDANDGQLTETISAFCRTCPQSALVLPAGGRGLGPNDRPMSQWSKKPGDRIGNHWLIHRSTKHATRQVTSDVNYWKTFVSERWGMTRGNPGRLELFGQHGKTHSMFADHMTSETRDRVSSERTGRTVDVWRLIPGRENHWLDCVVGAAIGASIEGVRSLAGGEPVAQRKRITRADLPQRRRLG